MEKYIGYGYTNNQGVATLDYDKNGTAINPSGYTGVGAGEVDFKAKLHDDSSVVSQPITVTDCIFYDEATSENTKWNGALQRSYSSNGTTLTATSAWQNLFVGSSTITFNLPFVVELDVTALSDTPSLRFYKDSSTNAPFTIDGTGHWKFEFKSDSIKVYQDGTEKQHWLSSLIGYDLYIGWNFSDTTDSVTFKDFKVYLI